MNGQNVYLDTYVLQGDMRIRLPKAIMTNLNAKKGKTKFDIYLNSEDESLILKVNEEKSCK
ncbi:MAG: sucrose-6-phosphate hydrolase [Sphaerochaetaceae bacterium]|nr:sucrose-6-phosphate hydrolase [Sphaerochaetaceae bacterium]